MQKIITDRIDIIKNLCERYDIQTMYLFGSICTDSFNESSDIDFLIDFKKEISVDRYTDNYFELHHQLEEIFKRRIDLLTQNSMSNPYFIESVKANRQLLYAA